MSCSLADCFLIMWQSIAPTLLVLHVAARPTSSSSDEESTDSRPLSDINFQPIGESSTGSDNLSDQSFSES